VLVPRGTRLRAQEIGLLAALGLQEVPVHLRPRVAIVSTGDEVLPIGESPGPGQVRDVNSYTLAALVEQAGGLAVRYGIVPDDLAALQAASRRALDETDMTLLSGGSSVGTRDFTLEVIAALPGAELLVHGVAIKPGKPTILARVGGKPFWGLPGQVTSAMVVFHALVNPALQQLSGLSPALERSYRIRAKLSRNVGSTNGRADLVRVRLREREGQLWADPLLGASGVLRSMVQADGLFEIPAQVEGLEQGAIVWVTPI